MDGASLTPKTLRFEDQIEAFSLFISGICIGKICSASGDWYYTKFWPLLSS
jgi:hypothetical protein